MHSSLSYRDTDSQLHRLHPFVLVAWVMAVVVAAVLVAHPLFLVVLGFGTILMAAEGRVLKSWWLVVRYTVWMGLAIVVINVIATNQGEHVVLQAGFSLPLLGTPAITLEALLFGGVMGVRLATIISAFTLLNLCVQPDDLMRAAIKLKLPYRSVLVTSLSTRFVPVLMEDARTVSDVQRSRGLEFDKGNLGTRVRSRGALILPLLSNSLDRAVQLAEAMESRAYGATSRRTFLRDTPLTRGDIAALVTVVAFLITAASMQISGTTAYTYYPTFASLTLGAAGLVWLLCFGGLAVSIIPVAYATQRRRND